MPLSEYKPLNDIHVQVAPKLQLRILNAMVTLPCLRNENVEKVHTVIHGGTCCTMNMRVHGVQ